MTSNLRQPEQKVAKIFMSMDNFFFGARPPAPLPPLLQIVVKWNRLDKKKPHKMLSPDHSSEILFQRDSNVFGNDI